MANIVQIRIRKLDDADESKEMRNPPGNERIKVLGRKQEYVKRVRFRGKDFRE